MRIEDDAVRGGVRTDGEGAALMCFLFFGIPMSFSLYASLVEVPFRDS